ncbi:MAG: prolyl oligopeptidase family serine peptidase [Acidobacteria bacterium]|nr:prolyl oligopeptidase family serine peptidase [Acidobacteriota bacterium]
MSALDISPAFALRLFLIVMLLIQVSPAALAQKAAAAPGSAASKPLAYPSAKKVEQVDDYHGTKVADHYRWLEDLDAPATKAWVEAQNRLTNAYLAEIPARQKIKERLTKLWNFERYGIPFREGDRYFYTKNDGLQNQSVLYTVASLADAPRVLLDPNKLSSDGTVALAGTAISRDGKLMAYGLSASGSDWAEWRVRNVETGQDLPDHVKWVKFSGASWTADGKGFFYSRYDEPKAGASQMAGVNEFQKLYYHRLGTPQGEDALIYERKDQKDWGFSGDVTEDGRYLIIHVWVGTDAKNRIYYKDLQTPGSPVVKLLDEFDAAYNFIDNDGAVFWFMTDRDAPRYKVIAIDTRRPERANWKVVIPEAAETLEGVNVVGDMFIASYLKDAHSQVRIHQTDGKFVREVALPGIGSASGFSGKRTDKETFYAYGSFTTPYPIYRYDLTTGKSTLFRQPKVDFDPDRYETKQVFYNSKDGTRVPMFITHRKGLKLDGTNPTLLYGYGGFNVSETPGFSISRLVWMEMGGVMAVANLRGGGEYGKDWHEAGMKLKKQNVFDDFIAAAEWLISNKYTSTPKLAIQGGSNGGLLVGAVLTQRPDLFGAALPAVGVMDMLRFNKFTIGAAWASDYGSPDNADEFKALYAYSPLHNLKAGKSYPPTLITTADHDDRVWPGHSFKFAAAMQAAQGGSAPVLIRIETKAGHGAGKPTSKIIEEYADIWGFLVRTFKMNAPA